MNETTGKTTSCLAITEKRAHRPGGCVGIFFQLFDWNRRFAKKKLFPKKLLPPARAKQTSKKFGEDDKMPKTKLHLIDDENSGGFPSVKKNGNRSGDIVEQKHEMRAPSLVARLMGLESMPTVHRDKHKKASNSVVCDVQEEKFVNDSHSGSGRKDLNLEKGGLKLESRPPKLQKTGQFERRAVTRFGAEALQIKGVLSRSRKHQHHKLASPLKSPRISSSSRNASRASRLIDAATRILEPGLQATNRSKCALTYSGSMNYTPRDEVSTDGMGVMLPDVVAQQQNSVSYNGVVGKSLMGQTSCKNCGNLLDVADSRPNVEEQPYACQSSGSNLVNTSSLGSETIMPRPTISCPERVSNAVYQGDRDQTFIATEKQDNTRTCSEPITSRKLLSQEGQVQRQLRSQQGRPQKDEPCSMSFKQRIQTQNEIAVARDSTPPRAKLSNLQSRRASSAASAVSGVTDFVALNRSLSGRSRPRVSTKADNSTIVVQRKFCSRRDDSLSPSKNPVRKRRIVSVNTQIENNGLGNSISRGQRNIKGGAVRGKDFGLNAHSLDHTTCIKNRLGSQGERNRANGNTDNNVISFTFNSPLRRKTSLSTGLIERMDQIDKNNLYHRKLVLDENDSKASSQKQFPLRGDALGMLLEQKLRELTSQEDDELAFGGTPPKSSTAMILQELISALTAEQPISPDGRLFNTDTPLQTGGKIGGTSAGFSHDIDHLSPGSVLEASFSNDSCLSSSLDDSSGHRLLPDCMDYSFDQPRPIETDTNLLDSATSMNGGRTGGKIMADLLNHISRILQSISLADGRLKGVELIYAKEVILNAELLFANASQYNSDKMKRFLIGPFLLDELESLAGAMWINFNCLLGFEESKVSYQLRRFLFDCVIECLDSKYGRYCNSGFKAWRRVPSRMNAEMLIQEIGEDVRRWTNLVGMIPDEIIEWEMSHSLGKWTDFEIEAFETGAEIDWDILQTLVEEIVEDFW